MDFQSGMDEEDGLTREVAGERGWEHAPLRSRVDIAWLH